MAEMVKNIRQAPGFLDLDDCPDDWKTQLPDTLFGAGIFPDRQPR
jgi:hypothetical protein